MHIAAANAQFEVINFVRNYGGRRCGNGYDKLLAQQWVYLAHQNKEGNTPLHVAVGHPNIDVTRIIYCYIWPGWSPGDKNDPEVHLHHGIWGEDEDDVIHMITLLFMKNKAGRDVIAQARYLGQEANAVWCEKALATMDPHTKWQSEETIARLTNRLRVECDELFPH